MAKEAKKKDKKNNNKNFLKAVRAELKKVIWPTPKQLFNNTLAVIVSVVIVGVIVFALDFCFGEINTFGIEKIKEVVQSTKNEETENTVSDESNTESTESNENTNTEENQENTESSEESNSENTENADVTE